jgi:hypothetical protein
MSKRGLYIMIGGRLCIDAKKLVPRKKKTYDEDWLFSDTMHFFPIGCPDIRPIYESGKPAAPPVAQSSAYRRGFNSVQ